MFCQHHSRKQTTGFWITLLIIISTYSAICSHTFAKTQNDISLNQHGDAIQLIVDGKPFLMLAGELGNSSASSLQYMDPYWEKLSAMNLNTVLAPVYWELIEPSQGQFDFALVDGLIKQARKHDLRLVLLWFGSWKNSMSCYVPQWIKTDYRQYPRSQLKDGTPLEMLSAFHDANRNVDKQAFTALMKHLKKVDARRRTVLMVQVENEIGMLTDARDHHPAANAAFAKPVPKELMQYLSEHKETLAPEVMTLWENSNFKTTGTWEEIFGQSLHTDELFMAWHYGRYVEDITQAGKAEYALPMYANAALIRPGHTPGQYPSAGPLPHLVDIWRAAAPSIDFISPDIYFPNFAEWCARYDIHQNAFFIPEAARGPDAAVHAFYAFGAHDAIGFSPFSIESEPDDTQITKSYDILNQLTPLILKYQGTENIAGCLLDKEHPTQEITIGNDRMKVAHDFTWGYSGGDTTAETWPRAGGIIIATGSNEFVIAGSGIIVTFENTTPDQQVGIANIQEGSYKNGKWHPLRTLNGDQSHQGRHLRIPYREFGIQQLTLYRYK